jgi:hypothetical protein
MKSLNARIGESLLLRLEEYRHERSVEGRKRVSTRQLVEEAIEAMLRQRSTQVGKIHGK